MSEHRNDRRLPPPAFPPGARKHVHRNSVHPPARDGRAEGSGTDPFIAPDDPMPTRSDVLQRAFISPDEPLPPRGTVTTGAGGPPPFATGTLHASLDPHVAELVEAVRKLAEGLSRKGEAGLKTTPGMSRFEATLRSYCVGYLAGRRAEGEATEA